jgi:hypothetical protein
VRIDQPHPPRPEPQQIDDASQRVAERALDVSGAVEDFGDLLEDAKVARARAWSGLTSWRISSPTSAPKLLLEP